MRARLAAGSVPQPRYEVVAPGDDVVAAADRVGYPCVVKPVSRAGSQGVIRADDPAAAAAAADRIRAIVADCPEALLVERFVPGAEVAVEAVLDGGRLDLLAVFDKPDPLNGPFFEETVYVTPSLQPPAVIDDLASVTRRAARALGLAEGPVHAEMRIGDDGAVTVLELAARSIGGLCARSLRFGAGISLEEVILRHALGLGTRDLTREHGASGVMMLPIRSGGVLVGVWGQDRALSVEGVTGIEISIAPGRPVVPLPEGDRYLGFLFARGPSPEAVVASLREAEACLDVRVR
jgi:biotin carboxylase